MSFGINRDYTATANRVKRNLAKHHKIMLRLIASGMTREQASVAALKSMTRGEDTSGGAS